MTKLGRKYKDRERIREDNRGFSFADVLGFWWVKLFGHYGPRVHFHIISSSNKYS